MAIPPQLTCTGNDKEFQFRDSFVMPLLLRLGFGVVVNGRNWPGAATDAVGAQAFEPGGG
jgi:hypothetical protein